MNIIDLHSGLWKALQDKRQRLPHALLLVGPAGIGKLEFAELFAAGLLCEAPLGDGRACAACPACNWLGQGNHPDFRRLRPAADEDQGGEVEDKGDKARASREITIDQVRGLDDFMHVGTHRHGLRVILIEPAEAMNRPTANALLKTLEEPGAGTVFLLVSHAPDQLLPTVRSRCQTLAVAKPGRETALRWLGERQVARPEHWLALAGGAPRLAEELAAGGQAALLEVLAVALAAGSRIAAVDAAGQIDKLIRADRRDAGLRQAVEWTQRWCHDLALANAGQEVRYFAAHRDKIGALAGHAEPGKLQAFWRKAIQFKRLSEHTLNNKLFLEDLLTDYASIFA